jgi:alcohol dehydrogenase
MDRLGCRRALILTGHTLATQTPIIQSIETLLEHRHAGTYAGIRQHAPESGITEALQLAHNCQVDILISVGGGSPIDAAKAVALRLFQSEGEKGAGRAPFLPHIAIPTTLSAAEFSHVAGYTDESSRSKTGFSDRNITPRIVFLDPELTLRTPMWLWLASGVRSLDHAVETLYSPGEHPLSDVLALQAIRDLFQFLPRSRSDPQDLEFRQRCQLAAWMSYFSPASVPAYAGLSHTIGKRIGATYDVPHGVTSCILLPHVMRFQAESDLKAARLAEMARALGRADDAAPEREAALAAADAVAGLVQELGLPSRLREVNVPQEAFESIARATAGDTLLAAGVIQILQGAC